MQNTGPATALTSVFNTVPLSTYNLQNIFKTDMLYIVDFLIGIVGYSHCCDIRLKKGYIMKLSPIEVSVQHCCTPLECYKFSFTDSFYANITSLKQVVCERICFLFSTYHTTQCLNVVSGILKKNPVLAQNMKPHTHMSMMYIPHL